MPQVSDLRHPLFSVCAALLVTGLVTADSAGCDMVELVFAR